MRRTDKDRSGAAVSIALMSDIHGNREAFEACLADARRRGVERFVLLGDYVGYGADPGWVVDEVRDLVAHGAIALKGNHDAAVRDPEIRMNPVAEAAMAWTRGRLDEGQGAFLAGLPLSAIDDDRLYVHANGWAPGDWGYVLTPVEAERSMRTTPQRYTYCGHTHCPMLYHMSPQRPAGEFQPLSGKPVPLSPSRCWLTVLGSVGQPRDGNPAACYGLLEFAPLRFTSVRVPYATTAAAAKIRAAGLPESLAQRLLEGR
jgi:diadenosine tetraphosphatase ApaH/serine/threonine PP2A family protein phosphatase